MHGSVPIEPETAVTRFYHFYCYIQTIAPGDRASTLKPLKYIKKPSKYIVPKLGLWNAAISPSQAKQSFVEHEL